MHIKPPDRIILATKNKNKIKEIKDYINSIECSLKLECFDNLPDTPETGTTFEENATIKARGASRYFHLPALAEDSGLVVPALGGAPGVLSARYAGPGASGERLIDKLLKEMKDLKRRERSAYYECAIVLALTVEGKELLIKESGKVTGWVTFDPRGNEGFGYDPIFLPENKELTFAEMPLKEKSLISHRARALKKFLASYEKLFNN